LQKLLKFAVHCGVSASMSSFMKNVGNLTNLARMATTPDEMMLGLLSGGAGEGGSLLVQPHLFAFGGIDATAAWLRSVAHGRFTLSGDGRKFAIES
jgi:methylenetetrahydrofolate reductase (NADPH)